MASKGASMNLVFIIPFANPNQNIFIKPKMDYSKSYNVDIQNINYSVVAYRIGNVPGIWLGMVYMRFEIICYITHLLEKSGKLAA